MRFTHSTTIAASAAKLFAIYADVAHWPTWDKEVESASLNGAFALGSAGKIKPKGAPESGILLVELTQNQSFTIECKLPLCKMLFIHGLAAQSDNTTVVTNELVFTGFLTPVFGRLIGKGIDKSMPGTLGGLKAFAEAA